METKALQSFRPPLNDLERMAAAIAKSGLFGMKTPEQALALMLISQAEGRHPALAARDYHIIEGRPSKKSEAILRDFIDAGGKVQWHVTNDKEASATFSHDSGGSVTITWDMAKASQAGLEGRANWKKYPGAMLRARVVSEGIRAVYPGATSGMYTPEEVQDFTPFIRNISPAKEDPGPEPQKEIVAEVEPAKEILTSKDGVVSDSGKLRAKVFSTLNDAMDLGLPGVTPRSLLAEAIGDKEASVARLAMIDDPIILNRAHEGLKAFIQKNTKKETA